MTAAFVALTFILDAGFIDNCCRHALLTSCEAVSIYSDPVISEFDEKSWRLKAILDRVGLARILVPKEISLGGKLRDPGGAFRTLAMFPTVHSLAISDGASLTPENFEALRGVIHLERLTISGATIGRRGMIAIGAVRRLQTVTFISCQIDPNVISVMRQSKVKDLGFSRMRFGEAEVKALSESKVERLRLAFTPITGQVLHSLPDLKLLRAITLVKCVVSANDEHAFRENVQHIELVVIKGANVEDKSAIDRP